MLNRFIKKKRTYEEIYGIDKAKRIKKRKSVMMSGKKNPMYSKGPTKGSFKEGHIVSNEIREKISLANKGKTISEETKQKISLAKKGIKNTKEHIQKFVESRKKNGWFKDLSKTREKMRLSHLGSFSSKETREKIKEKRAEQIFPVKDTSIELKIQNFLKELSIEFFTHQYMHIEHGYQCDILIPSMNLVIEVDGDYWHGNPLIYPNPNDCQQEQINEDRIRNLELIDKGFRVLRLWESEINVISIEQFKEKLKCRIK